MNYTENHRLARNFGRGASSRDFLAYFWFVAFLEFGHVGHKGLKVGMRKTFKKILNLAGFEPTFSNVGSSRAAHENLLHLRMCPVTG